MRAQKDPNRGTWYIQFYYRDWQRKNRKKFKRGFRTKAEAEEFAREFIQKHSLEMNFC